MRVETLFSSLNFLLDAFDIAGATDSTHISYYIDLFSGLSHLYFVFALLSTFFFCNHTAKIVCETLLYRASDDFTFYHLHFVRCRSKKSPTSPQLSQWIIKLNN